MFVYYGCVDKFTYIDNKRRAPEREKISTSLCILDAFRYHQLSSPPYFPPRFYIYYLPFIWVLIGTFNLPQ